MYTTYIQHIYKDIYILYIIHIQYCACQYLNIYSKWLYLYLSVILFYQTICLCEKFQFFRKTIIRSTNSHYDFYTNKSFLGGRSAQFVAQFYNKRKIQTNKIESRLSIIAYRNRTHLELRQLETVCEFANCAGRGRGLGERLITEDMTPTHIYIYLLEASQWMERASRRQMQDCNSFAGHEEEE